MYHLKQHSPRNRVVHAFMSFSSALSEPVVGHLQGNIFQLASSPNSMFVVQKIFKSGSALMVRRVYREIVNVPGALESSMTHPYGHYVVQDMLRRFYTLLPYIFNTIVAAVLAREEELQSNIYGVHVLRGVKLLMRTRRTF